MLRITCGAERLAQKIAGLLPSDSLEDCCKAHIPAERLAGAALEEVQVRASRHPPPPLLLLPPVAAPGTAFGSKLLAFSK